MPALRKSAVRRRWTLGLAFPLALVAFSSAQIRYLDVVFSTTTRWLFLAFLLATLVTCGDIGKGYRSAFAKIFLVYVAWCMTTSAWSELPLLSVLKVMALVLTTTIFIGAGYSWSIRQGSEKFAGFLFPLLLVTAFGAMPGPEPFNVGTPYYQGMALNPNDLGLLAAAALPLPVYMAYDLYSRKARKTRFMLWAFTTLLLLAVIWETGSRASMLCAVAVLGGFAVASSPSFRVTGAFIGALAIATAYLVVPQADRSFYEDVIAKGAQNGDVFYSRYDTWAASYAAAMEGGLLGLGYGVSASFTDFQFGFTSEAYGREKGNSQLAVWEETGIVGLGFYAFAIIAFVMELLHTFKRLPTTRFKVQYGLLGGLCVGLLIHSIFEAWWTAPGSPEFAIFFATAGVLSSFRRFTNRVAVRISAQLRPGYRHAL
jgi:hypothetical protein